MDHGFFMIFHHPGKIWTGCPNASCHSPCLARLLPSFLRSSYLVSWVHLHEKKKMNCWNVFFKYLQLRPHHKRLAPVDERLSLIPHRTLMGKLRSFDLYLLVVCDSNPGIHFQSWRLPCRVFIYSNWRCTNQLHPQIFCHSMGPSDLLWVKWSTPKRKHYWQWGNHVAQYFA